MFGNANWFEAGSRPFGLKPKGWPGKVYLAVWGTLAAAPTLLLLVRGQWLETAVWLAFVGIVGALDLRDVFKQRKQQTNYDNLLYIPDTASEQASTEKYDLTLKR